MGDQGSHQSQMYPAGEGDSEFARAPLFMLIMFNLRKMT